MPALTVRQQHLNDLAAEKGDPLPFHAGQVQHTPGPWQLKWTPPTPDYEYPYMDLQAGESDEDYFHVTGIVQGGNAHLMALSPEMFELLQNIEAALDRDGGPLARDHWSDTKTTIVANVRHLLRKATAQ